MKTIYVVTTDDKIVGEVKFNPFPNFALERYFFNAIAHAYGVSLSRIVTQEQYDKDHGIYRCVCCGINPVDALDGYDTCPDCIGKI